MAIVPIDYSRQLTVKFYFDLKKHQFMKNMVQFNSEKFGLSVEELDLFFDEISRNCDNFRHIQEINRIERYAFFLAPTIFIFGLAMLVVSVMPGISSSGGLMPLEYFGVFLIILSFVALFFVYTYIWVCMYRTAINTYTGEIEKIIKNDKEKFESKGLRWVLDAKDIKYIELQCIDKTIGNSIQGSPILVNRTFDLEKTNLLDKGVYGLMMNANVEHDSNLSTLKEGNNQQANRM